MALFVDDVAQSVNPEAALYGYWGAMLPEQKPRNALILGFGGGTIANLLARWCAPQILGIEQSARVIDIANRTGWIPGGTRLIVGDALEFLANDGRAWDYVAVDLFNGKDIDGRLFRDDVLGQLRGAVSGELAVNILDDEHAPERIRRIEKWFACWQMLVPGNVILHGR